MPSLGDTLQIDDEGIDTDEALTTGSDFNDGDDEAAEVGDALEGGLFAQESPRLLVSVGTEDITVTTTDGGGGEALTATTV